MVLAHGYNTARINHKEVSIISLPDLLEGNWNSSWAFICRSVCLSIRNISSKMAFRNCIIFYMNIKHGLQMMHIISKCCYRSSWPTGGHFIALKYILPQYSRTIEDRNFAYNTLLCYFGDFKLCQKWLISHFNAWKTHFALVLKNYKK